MGWLKATKVLKGSGHCTLHRLTGSLLRRKGRRSHNNQTGSSSFRVGRCCRCSWHHTSRRWTQREGALPAASPTRQHYYHASKQYNWRRTAKSSCDENKTCWCSLILMLPQFQRWRGGRLQGAVLFSSAWLQDPERPILYTRLTLTCRQSAKFSAVQSRRRKEGTILGRY